jgi:hypothetical protein
MRLRLLALLAPLCLFAGTQPSPAVAKQPDLPLDRTTTCVPSAAGGVQTGQSSDHVVLRIAVPGEVLDVTRTGAVCALIDWICPCASLPLQIRTALGLGFSRWPSATLSKSRSGEASSKRRADASQAERESTCPYLRDGAAEKAPLPNSTNFRGEVLENLDKLKSAQDLYAQAEKSRRLGKLADARRGYERIKKLCPGSRYDVMAANRLQHLNDQASAGDEIERFVEAVQKELAATRDGAVTSLEDRVAELVEEAQRDYADGRCAEAALLAGVAERLDPECPAARTLVEKCRGLRVKEKQPDVTSRGGRTSLQAQVVVRRKVSEVTATLEELEEEGAQYPSLEEPCFIVVKPDQKLVAESMERSGPGSWCGDQLRRLGSVLDRVTSPEMGRAGK